MSCKEQWFVSVVVDIYKLDFPLILVLLVQKLALEVYHHFGYFFAGTSETFEKNVSIMTVIRIKKVIPTYILNNE